ncbi:TrmH family RNA methyltransferase [Desulfovibrio aminophilus]|uniref:tRNA (cytidine(34)-2'-O)-methyltransferase n=1 Tax=Desulfovibrio aminophilus TaxID=81425 RepID=UPI00339B673F
MHLVLFNPEIPPNTGNVARLCAAMRVPLHLIEPLGFSLADRYLKRAGLDYWPHVDLHVHPDLDHFLRETAPARLVLSSARGGVPAHRFAFEQGDAIVLGPETTGLPGEVLALSEHLVRIPIKGQVRSLNMSTAAGILLHEALRRTGDLDD